MNLNMIEEATSSPAGDVKPGASAPTSRKQRVKQPPKRKTSQKRVQRSTHWSKRTGPVADLRRKLWQQKLEEKVYAPRRRKEVPSTRTGIPDGFTRETAAVMWAEARASAEKTMSELIEAGVVDQPYTTDDEAAVEAMTATLTIMRAAVNTDTRLKAANTILAYTKAKPEQKSKVTVESAEDWLKQCLAAEPAGISAPTDTDGSAGAN